MNGLMADATKANGKKTTCMGVVFTLGEMAVDTKENTSMIESMAMALTHGKMEDNMLASGRTENSMGMVCIDKELARKGEATGKRARESDGQMKSDINTDIFI